MQEHVITATMNISEIYSIRKIYSVTYEHDNIRIIGCEVKRDAYDIEHIGFGARHIPFYVEPISLIDITDLNYKSINMSFLSDIIDGKSIIDFRCDTLEYIDLTPIMHEDMIDEILLSGSTKSVISQMAVYITKWLPENVIGIGFEENYTSWQEVLSDIDKLFKKSSEREYRLLLCMGIVESMGLDELRGILFDVEDLYTDCNNISESIEKLKGRLYNIFIEQIKSRNTILMDVDKMAETSLSEYIDIILCHRKEEIQEFTNTAIDNLDISHLMNTDYGYKIIRAIVPFGKKITKDDKLMILDSMKRIPIST